MPIVSTSSISVAPEGLDELPEVFGHFLGKCQQWSEVHIILYCGSSFFVGALLLRFHFNMPLLSIDRATRSFFLHNTRVYNIYIWLKKRC